MGNTAKFMLVGVLAMVIVIAVIWDRASSDLEKAALVSGSSGRTTEVAPPTLTEGAQAEGTIHGRMTPEEREAEAHLEQMRIDFMGQVPPAIPEAPEEAQADIEAEAVQAARPAPASVKSYIVKSGESFWTIARDQYGDANLWEPLWLSNKERCPRPQDLREGQTIVLPEISALRAALPRVPARPVASVASNGGREYTVREGDCLGIISQKFYGTSKKWRLILDANNLEDETSLRAGMTITIPPDTN